MAWLTALAAANPATTQAPVPAPAVKARQPPVTARPAPIEAPVAMISSLFSETKLAVADAAVAVADATVLAVDEVASHAVPNASPVVLTAELTARWVLRAVDWTVEDARLYALLMDRRVLLIERRAVGSCGRRS